MVELCSILVHGYSHMLDSGWIGLVFWHMGTWVGSGWISLVYRHNTILEKEHELVNTRILHRRTLITVKFITLESEVEILL